MNAAIQLAADPQFNRLLAAAFNHVASKVPQDPLAAFSEAAASWAIHRAMGDLVALVPTLERLTFAMETDARVLAVERITLHFDGSITVEVFEHPDHWDLDDLDTGLRRLADQVALASPEHAAATAEARLETFAECLEPLLTLLLATGAEEFTVHRPAAA